MDGVDHDVGVQCDEGSKLHLEAVPDVFPAGAQLLCFDEGRRDWEWGEDAGNGQAAKEGSEPRESGGVPQDERLNADRRLPKEVGIGRVRRGAESTTRRKGGPDEEHDAVYILMSKSVRVCCTGAGVTRGKKVLQKLHQRALSGAMSLHTKR